MSTDDTAAEASGAVPNTIVTPATDLAPRFHELFRGCESAHGTYTISGGLRDDGKVEGRAVTLRNAVTDHLWKLHLEGKQGLGIIPIGEGDKCGFGAIDIDVYDGLDHAHIASTVLRL